MKSLIELVSFYHGLLGRRLVFLVLLSMVAALLEITSIGFFMPLLSGIESENPINRIFARAFSLLGIEFSITNILIAFMVLISLRTAILLFESAYTGRMTAGMLVDLRRELGRKIFRINYLRYLGKSSGILNNALIVESQNVTFSFRMFASLIVSTLLALAYSSMPILLNPVLVLIIVSAFAVLYPVLKAINGRTKRLSVQNSEHSGELQKMLIQSLNNFKYLKATGAHRQVSKHVDAQSSRLGALQSRLNFLQGLSDHGFEPIIALLISSVIYYYVVIREGNIAEYIFLVFMLMTTMRKILGMQQNLRKLLASWGSIGVIRRLQNDLEKDREVQPADARFDLSYFDHPIRLRNVDFSYNAFNSVLKDVSMDLAPNSTVAFVGESGGGKSTLVNLLVGLHEPTGGQIHLGPIPYRELDKEKFRARVGYITQESVIFNDTIRNNITLWEPESGGDETRLQSALAKARLLEFVAGLEKGTESVLGEGGVNISGGQRQRISIARELYKDAKIIVFDEATSALDTKTEREIQRNIDDFKGQKTIILIAHRLSTVRNCDRIFVLKDGRIVESGSYDDLMRRNGEFRRMVDLQEEKAESVS